MPWNPRTFSDLQLVTDIHMNEIRDNFLHLYPVVTPYTPAWTSDGTQPAIGNGVRSGRYSKVGKRVVGEVLITMGSTTTYGTGVYALALPSTAAYGTGSIGAGHLLDSGTNRRLVNVILGSTTVLQMFHDTATGSGVGATSPFTFAVGDQIYVQFAYMEA